MPLHFRQLISALFGAALVVVTSLHGVLHVSCGHDHGHCGSGEHGCSHDVDHDDVVNAADLRIPHLGCAVCAASLDGSAELPNVDGSAQVLTESPVALVFSPCRLATGFTFSCQGRAPPA